MRLFDFKYVGFRCLKGKFEFFEKLVVLKDLFFNAFVFKFRLKEISSLFKIVVGKKKSYLKNNKVII